MKRVFRIIGLLLVFILVVGGIGVFVFLKNQAPQYSGEISRIGLKSEVKVYFDDYGIPHIYANDAIDAYRSLGYLHAQDRLFQMELLRRLSSGQLSEIFGEKLIPTDKFFRTLGIHRMSKKAVESEFRSGSKPWQQEAKAYVDGVNDFIKRRNQPIEFDILGIEKRPYTLEDMYSILGYMGLGFSQAIKEDHLWTFVKEELGDDYLEEFMEVTGSKVGDGEESSIDYEAALSYDVKQHLDAVGLPLWYGSNGWVVSGEKSFSGKPILANDTHISISQPSVWYEAHLTYPGQDFYGNYLAGVPFGVIGHNRRHGWGLTIFPFDNMDMFREQWAIKGESFYYRGDTVQANKIVETIKVKDGKDIDYEVIISPHGPIMNDVSKTIGDNNEDPIALWWTFYDRPTKNVEVLRNLGVAKSFEEVKYEVSRIDFLGLNFLYGDIDGNIARWSTGRIPNRPIHVNSNLILDGASGLDDPIGYYPFSYNPHDENPESGYVASANNAPDTIDGQFIRGYFPPNNRINRIRKLLSSQDVFHSSDMKRIQLDVLSHDHKKMAELMTALVSESGLNEIEENALLELKAWDGMYTLDRVGPVVFTKLLYVIADECMSDELGAANFEAIQSSYIYKGGLLTLLFAEHSKWWDDVETEESEFRKDIFIKAFKRTIQELSTQLGTDVKKWKWRDVHTITHEHPLGKVKPLDRWFNVGPFSVTGGNDVPNKMMHTMTGSGEYKVTSSPALRILLDFGNIDRSESINPTGQSGNIMSPHYKDQAEMFLNGEYRAQMMNEDEIKGLKRKLVLGGKVK